MSPKFRYGLSNSTKSLALGIATVSEPRLIGSVCEVVSTSVGLCNHCDGGAGMTADPFVFERNVSSHNTNRMPPGHSQDTRRSMLSTLCSSRKRVG